MYFRVWLPVLHSVAMTLVLWMPWDRAAHNVDVVLTNGLAIHEWALVPRFGAIEWAQGMNLPAMAIVMPVRIAIRGSHDVRDINLMFFGLWAVGLCCWYMVGRFIDDFVFWRRARQLPALRRGDLVFALLLAPSVILLAGAFLLGDADVPFAQTWAVIWAAIALSVLMFRVAQAIRQWHRPPTS